MKKLILLLGVILFGMAGCNKPTDNPQPGTTPYELSIPQGFPAMTIPADNLLTREGVALGRKLYYDPRLHKEGTMACATCHVQQQAFSSSPAVLPHINLGWSRNFLWNGKIQGSLEDVMLFEVEDFFETDMRVLNSDANYRQAFKQVFGSETITSKEVAKALAQFVRTLISGNSKFDRFLRGEVNLTNQEYLGYELFYTERGDCFHCHATAFMTDNLMHNNALDSLPDAGYFAVTGDSLDWGKFKTPTLRNIEYTAPYMHDGRYATLEEVVAFYSTGLEASPTVDPLMKNLHQGGVQLNAEEQAALVAFLKTLSDPDFISNPEYQPDK